MTDSPTNAQAPQRDPFAPPAILEIGAPGGGKTDALATIAQCGIETFVVGTEPRYVESLLDGAKRRGVDKNLLHWATVEPMKASFSSLIRSAELVNSMSYQGLTDIKMPADKRDYNQFIKLLQTLSDFKCERTGKSYGPVDSWSSDKCLVVDSLSGINIMAYQLMQGSKPTAAQGEWGVAMNTEVNLINKLTSDTRCMFVLTAHVEREADEVSGGSKMVASALGRKVGPTLPRFFSEVVLAYHEGPNHYWSTMMSGYELKKRVLPYSDKLEPTFKPIIEAWRSRLAEAKGGAA